MLTFLFISATLSLSLTTRVSLSLLHLRSFGFNSYGLTALYLLECWPQLSQYLPHAFKLQLLKLPNRIDLLQFCDNVSDFRCSLIYKITHTHSHINVFFINYLVVCVWHRNDSCSGFPSVLNAPPVLCVWFNVICCKLDNEHFNSCLCRGEYHLST